MVDLILLISAAVILWLFIGFWEVKWAYKYAQRWQGDPSHGITQGFKEMDWVTGFIVLWMVFWPLQLLYFLVKSSARDDTMLCRLVKGKS